MDASGRGKGKKKEHALRIDGTRALTSFYFAGCGGRRHFVLASIIRILLWPEN